MSDNSENIDAAVPKINASTTEIPPTGYKTLGIVTGIQAKSMNIFQGILTNVAAVFGTNETDWTQVTDLFHDTRREAIKQMKKKAIRLGATDIIGVRIDVSELSRGQGTGMLVVTAYGTAIAKDNVSMQNGGVYKRSRKHTRGRKHTS